MDIQTFIQEEFIMESYVLLLFFSMLLVALFKELLEKKKQIDDLTKFKLKKIYSFAYAHFFNGNKEETKKQTVNYLKDIYNKKLVNEKYDLIKGA